jgi:hypothetical protein
LGGTVHLKIADGVDGHGSGLRFGHHFDQFLIARLAGLGGQQTYRFGSCSGFPVVDGGEQSSRFGSKALHDAQFRCEGENGEARSGRNGLEIFDDLRSHINLIGGLRVQPVEQQNVHRIRGLHGL